MVGIHTAKHGSAFNPKGLGVEPEFGERAVTVGEFLERAQPSAVTEITTLKPESGEPAISHIRAAFSGKAHVITANKGPIAHAQAELKEEAQRAGVEFRFESTVMDGTPVFNKFRNDLPGIKVLGFTVPFALGGESGGAGEWMDARVKAQDVERAGAGRGANRLWLIQRFG